MTVRPVRRAFADPDGRGRIEEVSTTSGQRHHYSPWARWRSSQTPNVTIEVIDHGPGIPESALRDSFQLARLPSRNAAQKEGSSGLGLWIVRKIVEAHLGLVYARSEPGKGTRVSIMLPTLRPGSRMETRPDRSGATE
jgi:signal transduction histidine kinase